MRRLTNRNYNVKWKVLLVIKQVAMKGSPNFRRDVTRENLADIKACLQFSGPPDPLRGDQIYARVRDGARAAIEAVTSTVQIQNSYGGTGMAGMGSDSFGGGGGGGGGSFNSGGGGGGFSSGGAGGGGGGGFEVSGPGRMTGIGSHPYDPNAKEQSKLSSIKSAGEHRRGEVWRLSIDLDLPCVCVFCLFVCLFVCFFSPKFPSSLFHAQDRLQ